MENNELIELFVKMQESIENIEKSSKDIENTVNFFFCFYIAIPIVITIVLFVLKNFYGISVLQVIGKILG